MVIHYFALNSIDLNNVINIGTVFVQPKILPDLG